MCWYDRVIVTLKNVLVWKGYRDPYERACVKG